MRWFENGEPEQKVKGQAEEGLGDLTMKKPVCYFSDDDDDDDHDHRDLFSDLLMMMMILNRRSFPRPCKTLARPCY